MANPTQSAQTQQQRVREKGRIMRALSIPFAFIGLLLGSLFISVLIEWIGLCFYWREQGWHHARDMLNNEVQWIANGFAQSLVVDNPGRTAKAVIDVAYVWMFEKTGLIEWINYSAAQSRINGSQAQGAHQYLGMMYVALEDYGLAAVYTVLTFLTRLVILTLSVPLFLMAAFTGAVDGLVRRDLRRFGAGRESGFIYHRAKMLVVPVGVAPWVIYLAMPVSVSPVLILLPCAVVLGGVVSVTVGSFKKYL
ncbi:TIGR03747 family integrating conjugative element membrane protein [Pseudomonas sp. v388]|uniref:TIGR03747 family integrating conjugative element membrane protein n=1 Tax=Pseudomonas sp. v388 TaxID=2479849 RepID=UPI000F76B40E|nr:TIGR03747 family integrating conjugative element membrane protein [Pseudomonas sp. v388]RRV10053.1 TIGR03747 family integrating conjugative element membrane protein [Pseudomonas sp. v388]